VALAVDGDPHHHCIRSAGRCSRCGW
jgi:hypothetical protein